MGITQTLNGFLYSKGVGFQLKMSAFRPLLHRQHWRYGWGEVDRVIIDEDWRRMTKYRFGRSVVGYASPMAWLLWERDEHQQLLAFLDSQQRNWKGRIANFYTVHFIQLLCGFNFITYNWKCKCTASAVRDIAQIIYKYYAAVLNF